MSGVLVHVGVTVSDLERSLRFYTQGLGLDVAVRQTSAADYLALTGHPGVEIATAFVEAPGDGINDGGAAVYLRDPDGYTIELFQPAT